MLSINPRSSLMTSRKVKVVQEGVLKEKDRRKIKKRKKEEKKKESREM